MKKVKIGLIGLGFMGTTHFRIHQGLPYAEIAAVADLEPDKRKGDISSVIGNIGNADNSKPLDFSKIAVYENAFEMIEKADIDIVDICVPTPWHTQYILAALKAGRHVFSEKPLCRTKKELRQLEAAVKDAKTYFNCGLCIRAWPEYRYVYEQLQAGTWGKVREATFRRLSPTTEFNNNWHNWYMFSELSGGAIMDLHLHDTDCVYYFFGRPSQVSSYGTNLNSDNGCDHVITYYKFNKGPLVVAEGGWGAAKTVPFEMSFQLICDKATVRLEATGALKIYWTDGRIDTIPGDAALPTGWHQELAYFDKCVAEGVVPDKYQTPAAVFDSYKILLAEMKSVENNRPVRVSYR